MGIEYSPGRCEVWIRPDGINATVATCCSHLQSMIAGGLEKYALTRHVLLLTPLAPASSGNNWLHMRTPHGNQLVSCVVMVVLYSCIITQHYTYFPEVEYVT